MQLKEKREELIESFLKGKEPAFITKHASLLDSYFYHSFEKSMAGHRIGLHKKPYAIVALGGYGRQEQCICSDVDVLFLFSGNVPSEAEELVKEMIYPLWDMGLDVGHATRTAKDCIELSVKDIEVFTSILDARFICGVSSLYTELMANLRKRIPAGKAGKMINMLVERNRERHESYGDSSYRLEPNLKQGDGGLRDYHTMLWVAKIEMNLKHPRDLEYFGILSDNEFKELNRSLSFIWTVRNHLHYFVGRKYDQLHFEYQKKIAEILRFKEQKGQMAVERFLGELHGRMEFIRNHNVTFLSERGYVRSLMPQRKQTRTRSNVPGLEVVRNMLQFSSSEAVMASRNLLLKIFEESSRLRMPLSSEARRVVKEFSHLIDRDFRTDELNIKSFEKILLANDYTFEVLNEMLHIGFLMRFIPEMKKIHNRIQYDAYHIYPVDRHSLYTVKVITNFASKKKTGEEILYSNLYQGLGRYKKFLLWAALLHDTGKGYEGRGHSKKGANIAEKVINQAGYKPRHVETVSFLVNEHLLLVKTATRRDINDEETSLFCARKIKSIRLLKMLYLLTVADSMATGPKAWNEWTATLLQDLFFKILRILEKGELASDRAVEAVRKKEIEIFASARSKKERRTVEACLDFFSPRYLLYTPSKDIPGHITLYNQLKDSEFVWNIEKNQGSETRTVTICAKDRPGLFSKISGIFTLNGLDILDAQAYTWRNGIILDIFKLTAPADLIFEDDSWRKAENNLRLALSGKLDIAGEIKKRIKNYNPTQLIIAGRPHRINIDNQSSSFFTIIEVFANDFPGLLFNIADALFRCDLNVHVAKIATKVDQAADIFYVKDLNGGKIESPERESEIKAALEAVLEKITQDIFLKGGGL